MALEVLTAAELPPLRVVRPAQVVQVVYGFVDASGTGLGSTVQGFCVQKLSEPVERERLRYRVGVWGKDEETESSNYRELANLVMTVETEAEAGRLDNTEFFLFTDNSTAESAFYKGSSTSKNLHALVLRLRQLELRHGLILHVIHVSGKRMIAQGTDGCSRGVLLEGVMAGEDMLSFVDLAKSAFKRSPKLLDWIQSWCLDSGIQPLKPEDWFERGHGIVGGKKDLGECGSRSMSPVVKHTCGHLPRQQLMLLWSNCSWPVTSAQILIISLPSRVCSFLDGDDYSTKLLM
jgi:hypothetical protein